MLSIIKRLTARNRDRSARLRVWSVFHGLPRPELEFLGRQLDELDLDPDFALTVEGRPSQTLWFIEEGTVGVWSEGELKSRLKRGAIHGPISMPTNDADETAITLGPVKALVAGPTQIRTITGHPQVRRRLLALEDRRLAVSGMD